MDLSTTTLLILTGTGFLAGFVDSIAGGGGLITLPALLTTGMPPTLALGTNKLQSSFGSLFATLHYRKAGLVKVRKVILGIFCTILGAVLGTFLVQQLDNSSLKIIIPFLLLVIFIYFFLSPKIGEIDRHQKLSQNLFFVTFGLLLGFYDGFFGPGAGSFWAVAFVALLGFNLKKATAHTKVMNFTSNIVSLATFLFGQSVHFKIGLCMGIGQILGATVGSHLVILKGTRFVRIFFLTVVGATLIKMFASLYF